MTIKNLLDRILENWPVKIICLALAVLLFLFYRLSTLEERFFSVPLTVEAPNSLVPSGSYPTMINVKVRGENAGKYPLQEGDISAYIDLSPFTQEGEVRVPVRTRLNASVVAASPLELSAEPSEITLILEYRSAKKIPLRLVSAGVPETGSEYTGYTVNPSIVEITGPRTVIDLITELSTEPVDITGKNEGFEGTVQVDNPYRNVKVNGNARISFSVSIAKTSLTRGFDNVPFYFENLAEGLEAVTDFPNGRIQIKGARSDVNAWSPTENALTILCETVTGPGTWVLPVYPVVEGPFEIVSFFPQEVVLEVKRVAQ